MVVIWMFDGVGYHETSKCAELSYKLGYLIIASLFCPVRPFHTARSVRPVCPVFPDRQGLYVPAKVYLHRPHYELPSL